MGGGEKAKVECWREAKVNDDTYDEVLMRWGTKKLRLDSFRIWNDYSIIWILAALFWGSRLLSAKPILT